MGIIATAAAPTGILTAINSFAQMQNQNGGHANIVYSATPDATMLAKAGLVAADWNNLVTALGGASTTNLLKLLNAVGLMVTVEQQPFPIAGSIEGGAITDPVGKRVASLFGDLS